jgi:hypothetical protein
MMKKDKDEVLAGKFAFTAHSSCKPAGVSSFDVRLGGCFVHPAVAGGYVSWLHERVPGPTRM